MKGIATAASFLLLLPGALGFASHRNTASRSRTSLQALSSNEEFPVKRQPTKHALIQSMILPLAMAGVLALAPPVWADEEAPAPAPAPATMTIEACKKNPTGTTNCVSTRNVKQLDLYAPPWTFEGSAAEAAARIKGVVASDSNLELLSEQDGVYFQIQSRIRVRFTDTLDILINPSDKVVTFKASETGEPIVSDFGAIRKELDSIRSRCKFGVMGQNVGAADAMPSQNGPLGQLKAFYGLQSGQGFEQVFEEK